MKNNLLELNGIDNINDYSFKWILEDNVEGVIDFKNKKLLGATISKQILNSKIIEGFEEKNIDNVEIYNNIFICSVKFNIAIEYCENQSFGRINLLNHMFYKTFYKSLKDFNFCNIDEEILTIDLYLNEIKDKLSYFLEVAIGINEL